MDDRALRPLSILAFGGMVAGIVWMFMDRTLIAGSAAGLVVQGAAVALMLWARVAFGHRSFHPGADPTAGGLVTRGPYRFLRHPIYAAVCYFAWAAALDTRAAPAFAAALLVTAGAVARMLAEEHLLSDIYPEYAEYRRRTARIIPFVV
jgi:protein-S-isoprenylcysteine O-methyltransferase Ste14